jgi:hypothetical protein
MSWWMQVLSFVVLYVVSMNLVAMFGTSGTTQLIVGIFFGIVGTMALNSVARQSKGTDGGVAESVQQEPGKKS